MKRLLIGYQTIVLPRFFHIILVCSIFANLTACEIEKDGFVEMTSSKNSEQILEDAEFAITEQNFRINNRLHIGKAIRERGDSSFPDYEVILFCNLGYAKKMLELAPDYISYCPQRLIIRDAGQHRIITAALLPDSTSNQALNSVTGEINMLMREIVAFAATDWPELDE
jgi:uncharacterized protein (DUF302 family)